MTAKGYGQMSAEEKEILDLMETEIENRFSTDNVNGYDAQKVYDDLIDEIEMDLVKTEENHDCDGYYIEYKDYEVRAAVPYGARMLDGGISIGYIAKVGCTVRVYSEDDRDAEYNLDDIWFYADVGESRMGFDTMDRLADWVEGRDIIITGAA